MLHLRAILISQSQSHMETNMFIYIYDLNTYFSFQTAFSRTENFHINTPNLEILTWSFSSFTLRLSNTCGVLYKYVCLSVHRSCPGASAVIVKNALKQKKITFRGANRAPYKREWFCQCWQGNYQKGIPGPPHVYSRAEKMSSWFSSSFGKNSFSVSQFEENRNLRTNRTHILAWPCASNATVSHCMNNMNSIQCSFCS